MRHWMVMVDNLPGTKDRVSIGVSTSRSSPADAVSCLVLYSVLVNVGVK